MPGVNGKRKRPDAFLDGELVALHRARVVDWSPTAITAIAATTDGTVLAVARESGSIELWNTEHWQCIKVGDRSCCLRNLAVLSDLSLSCSCTAAAYPRQGEFSYFRPGMDI